MRKLLLLSAFCALAAVPAAYAGSGVIGGAFIAGEATGNQGMSSSNTATTWGQGSSTGSSASGTEFYISGSGRGSSAQFESNGQANSSVFVAPSGVTSTSSHSAFSTGSTHGDGSFSANNQTFGQSAGQTNFSSTEVSKSAAYNNTAFEIVGAAGFVGYENGFAPE
jgi:hypothetical protein